MSPGGPLVQVGARGWRHPQWASAFYPEDLPSDWRLDYYFNEFHALWLRPADLAAAEDEEWQALAAADPARHPLLLECAGGSAGADHPAGLPGAAGLAPLARVTAVDGGWAWTVPGAPARPVWQPGEPAPAPAPMVVALLDGVVDLRRRRAELETLLAAAGERLLLLLDGRPPSPQHLRELRQLAELLT